MDTLEMVAAATGGRRVGPDAAFSGVTQDTRQLTAGDLYVALRGPNFDGHSFLRKAAALGAAGALVDTPAGGGLPQVVVDDTLRGLQQLASAWRDRFAGPVAGITGSNGKTTVKQMLHAVLTRRGDTLATAGNLNNHVGLPLTLLRLRDTHAAAVLEMGANKLGDIAELAAIARPDVGVVTNAAGAHLEGFGSLDAVAQTKGALFERLADTGTAVINADDRYADLWRALAGGRRRIEFALDGAADITAADVSLTPQGSRFQLTTPAGRVLVSLPVAGRHNVMNALAAAGVAHALDVSLDDIAAGLAATQAAPGRLTHRRASNGATVIDDTYNANPASLAAALAVLAAADAPRWLVLGDMNELGDTATADHAAAGEQARTAGVQRLFTVGNKAAAAAQRFGQDATHCPSMQALIDTVAGALPAEATVLVKGSRGAAMERLVHALTAPHTAREAG